MALGYEFDSFTVGGTSVSTISPAVRDGVDYLSESLELFWDTHLRLGYWNLALNGEGKTIRARYTFACNIVSSLSIFI